MTNLIWELKGLGTGHRLRGGGEGVVEYFSGDHVVFTGNGGGISRR